VKEGPIKRARDPKARKKMRSWWLKQLHTWHWISAAISLVGMLLFAITGLTLNHASAISAKPVVTQRTAALPASLLRQLNAPFPADAMSYHPVSIRVNSVRNDDAKLIVRTEEAELHADTAESEPPSPVPEQDSLF
jgi:hypothetical protein